MTFSGRCVKTSSPPAVPATKFLLVFIILHVRRLEPGLWG